MFSGKFYEQRLSEKRRCHQHIIARESVNSTVPTELPTGELITETFSRRNGASLRFFYCSYNKEIKRMSKH